MAHPGPAKGHGGRPRKPGGSRLSKGSLKGYVKVTVGPPGKGKQYYKHRVVAGATHAGKNRVVDHKNDNKSDDSSSNLQVVSRGQNTAFRNRDYGKGGKRHLTPHTPTTSHPHNRRGTHHAGGSSD